MQKQKKHPREIHFIDGDSVSWENDLAEAFDGGQWTAGIGFYISEGMYVRYEEKGVEYDDEALVVLNPKYDIDNPEGWIYFDSEEEMEEYIDSFDDDED